MIPRISLWTRGVDIPFRLVKRPFDEYYLTAQAEEIQQASPEILRITPAAMYILSSITGRRIVDPIRWVILDSLQDVLTGNLRTIYPERQDLLASTFGELLGALFFALQLKGNIEIIRLLESNDSKVPDYAILQSQGNDSILHLLECKGIVGDVRNINQRQNLDVCKRIRRFRKAGLDQLRQVGPEVSSGPRVKVQSSNPDSLISRNTSSINLSVAYIPDARILTLIQNDVEFAERACCTKYGINCLKCLDSGFSDHTNVINVLHREQTGISTSIRSDLRDFFNAYRVAQRDLWAEDNWHFISSIRNLARLAIESDYDSNIYQLAVTLLEEGTRCGFNLREIEDSDWFNILQDSSQYDRMRQLRRKIRKRDYRFTANETQSVKRKTIPAYIEEYLRSDPHDLRNTHFGTTLIFRDGVAGHKINGTVSFHNDTALIRLTMESSRQTEYETLRSFATDAIRQIRNNSRPIEWREAKIELPEKEQKLSFGECWDEFPYSHPSANIPGITAWVSRYGRAEITVRTDTPNING
jgi:hypothetical protein